MGRSTVELRCPGTATNYTVIVGTPWQAKYGLGNPQNVGSCELFIVPLNQDGNPIGDGQKYGLLNVKLTPGQSLPWYFPPQSTARIAAVCTKFCDGGRAILEYDTPDS